ncbi:MAG: homoserine dehydrogenase [Lachnospiraceae bacterium]|nr:homoserine dehydrogenase [Lachnospiraceae bacterium]
MIQAAVLGYGTVGSGVVEVLYKNKDLIAQRSGEEIEVKYILDLREFPGDPFENKVVHDVNVILDDPEISIVCETMGGIKPAYQFTKDAILKGKSVCTSNKELVAAHGPELLRLAKEHNCNYMFEASVGGGIPIIRPLNTCLAPESIEKIMGILNGTTNYILTKMAKEGASFDEVLKEAQEKGYAERNPEADVEGHDACRKIAILSSLMTGKNVRSEQIYTEGITKISTQDFAYAKHLQKSIKLLAMSERTDNGAVAMVAPFMIGEEHPLNGVNDVFNAVYVTGNMVGDLMFYGQGAGKLATASAVVADVIDCAKHQGKNVPCRWEEEDVTLCDMKESKRRFFVRASMDDRGAAINSFGRIDEIRIYDEEFAFITEPMAEKEFDTRLNGIRNVLSVIRVED